MIRFRTVFVTLLLTALVVLQLPRQATAAPREKTVAGNTNRTIRVLKFQAPQYDTNGVKTAMLTGNEAVIYPDRMTEISGLGLEIFRNSSTGSYPDVRITSPKCFYNPDKGYAISEDTIRIARNNMVITGSNYVINSKENRMQINHDAKVVFMGMKGGAFDAFISPSSNAPPKKTSNAGK